MKKVFKGLAGILVLFALIFIFLIQVFTHNFDTKLFNGENVYKNIEELSSAKYDGRQAGTEGNSEALKYIESYFKSIGIAPAGDNGTYYQDFKTMMPVYNSSPEFMLTDKDTNEVKSFKYGEDFREVLDGLGGNGNVSGNLYFFQGDIKKVSKEVISSYIIVPLSPVTDEDLQYAADNGCKAILLPGSNVTAKKGFDMQTKSGKSMIIFKISDNTSDFLKKHIDHNLSAKLKVDVSFKLQDTPNLLGKIDGSDKSSGYIIISSHMDGAGEIGNGTYAPGSLHDASGTAIMMELAKSLTREKVKPEKTIIFAAWNDFEEGRKGSQYYTDNPIFPLDKSQVIVLDAIGSNHDNKLYLTSYGDTGETLESSILSYISKDKFSAVGGKSLQGEDTEAFLEKDVPAVLIYGDSDDNIVGLANDNRTIVDTVRTAEAMTSTPMDNMNNISKERLQNFGDLMMSYFQREIYKDWYHNILDSKEIAVIAILIITALITFCIKEFYKLMPAGKIMGFHLESIYYSTFFKILDRLSQISLTLIAAAFLIVFIAYIPTSFDIIAKKGSYIANYSVFTIANNALYYIRDFTVHGFGKTENYFSILYIISFSIGRSILLIVSSITLAFVIGTTSGILTAFKRKKNRGGKFLGAIAVMSLPDVFIAILFQLLMMFLYSHNILLFLLAGNEESRFVFPFLCLAIIPTAYIARISQIAVREEINKDYITAARAKGLSNFKILKNHLLRIVTIKVVDALPTVLNVIISNLIIVEYFFSYHGIVYQLFSFFKEGDVHASVGMVIGMGAVYCILSVLLKLISLGINPVKRHNTAKSSM